MSGTRIIDILNAWWQSHSVKKAMGKTRHQVLISCMHGKITLRPQINTLWRAISIHRLKTVLLLQQCRNQDNRHIRNYDRGPTTATHGGNVRNQDKTY
jgi:hypothetical protein